MKEKYKLEYPINVTPKILYDRLSTPWGLSEWFADDVKQNKDIYTFIWDNYEQEAQILNQKDQKHIKYKWLEDGENDKECYFEFTITLDELTNDVALEITDFAEKDDKEDAIE